MINLKYNEKEHYINLKSGCENKLEENYGKIITTQNNLDSIITAISKMDSEILALEEINASASKKFGQIIKWYGTNFLENYDLIYGDMQTKYDLYIGELRDIRYILAKKQGELEGELEELKQSNSNIYDMIGIYAYKIQLLMNEE